MKYEIGYEPSSALPYILIAIDEEYDTNPGEKHNLFRSNHETLISVAIQMLDQEEPRFKSTYDIGIFDNLHTLQRSEYFGTVLYHMQKALEITNQGKHPKDMLFFKADSSVNIIDENEIIDDSKDSGEIKH